jgi:AcrR family transcriptional regulator
VLGGKPDFIVLSREAIVSAARSVVAENGVRNLTMRTVADELHVAAGSLYRHVTSRDEILNDLAERVFSEVELPSADVGDWGDRFKIAALRIYDAFAALPGLGSHVLTQPDWGPSAARLYPWMSEAVLSAGLSEAEKDEVVRVWSVLAIATIGLDPGGAAHGLGLLGSPDYNVRPIGVDRARSVLAEAVDVMIDGLRRELAVRHA